MPISPAKISAFWAQVMTAARAHHRGDVAVHEGVAGHVGDADHGVDDRCACPRRSCRKSGDLARTMLGLHVVGQIVEGGDHRPAVHLALIDLLGAVVQPGRIAQPDGVGGREQPEIFDAAGSPGSGPGGSACPAPPGCAGSRTLRPGARHHIRRTPGRWGAGWHQGSMPSRNSVTCLPSLQHDGVLADEVDPTDVAVQVDPHQGPVQAGGGPARYGSTCRCRDSPGP